MKHLLTQFGLSVGLASYATVGSPSADRRRQQLKHITFMLLFLLGSLNVWGADKTFTKITSTDDLESGKLYLIVCESKSRLFKASLASSGANGESETIVLENNSYTCDETFAFTITGTSGAWKITGANGSIGHISGANTLGVNTSVTNTIAFDGGDAIIGCDSRVLKCNYASATNILFRYYSSGQQSIQLYKESGSGNTTVCAVPTFSPVAGEVESGTEVTLSTTTEGATIHYTLDGSDPDENSATYSSAITIDEEKTIKAIAVKEGLTKSNVATATYTIATPKTIAQVLSGIPSTDNTEGAEFLLNDVTAMTK